MSIRILVIPEDPTHNGYILQPLIEAILEEVGRPRAKVTILSNPRLTGYDHALAAIEGELVDRYRHMDPWIFIPDADRASSATMARLESDLREKGTALFACAAQPEVEIYACLSRRERLGVSWDEARNHPRFKEQIFAPFLTREGNRGEAGAGRKSLTLESTRNRQLLFQLCPELASLRERLHVHFQTR